MTSPTIIGVEPFVPCWFPEPFAPVHPPDVDSLKTDFSADIPRHLRFSADTSAPAIEVPHCSVPVQTTSQRGKIKRKAPFKSFKHGPCREDIVPILPDRIQTYTDEPAMMVGETRVARDFFKQPDLLKELLKNQYGASAGFVGTVQINNDIGDRDRDEIYEPTEAELNRWLMKHTQTNDGIRTFKTYPLPRFQKRQHSPKFKAFAPDDNEHLRLKHIHEQLHEIEESYTQECGEERREFEINREEPQSHVSVIYDWMKQNTSDFVREVEVVYTSEGTVDAIQKSVHEILPQVEIERIQRVSDTLDLRQSHDIRVREENINNPADVKVLRNRYSHGISDIGRSVHPDGKNSVPNRWQPNAATINAKEWDQHNAQPNASVWEQKLKQAMLADGLVWDITLLDNFTCVRKSFDTSRETTLTKRSSPKVKQKWNFTVSFDLSTPISFERAVLQTFGSWPVDSDFVDGLYIVLKKRNQAPRVYLVIGTDDIHVGCLQFKNALAETLACNKFPKNSKGTVRCLTFDQHNAETRVMISDWNMFDDSEDKQGKKMRRAKQLVLTQSVTEETADR